MCRNITILRGLQPPATAEEIEAAARQYVRKVSGATKPPVGRRGGVRAGHRGRGGGHHHAPRTSYRPAASRRPSCPPLRTHAH